MRDRGSTYGECLVCGSSMSYNPMHDKVCCPHEGKHKEAISELIAQSEKATFVEYDPKKGPPQIPMAKDQLSLADSFENEIENVVMKYCGQGMTIGSALGALQNRMFHLMLNIHLPTIVDVVRKSQEGR